MKRMSVEDIPAFLAEVIAAGCDPTAIGSGYLIGDGDLPEPACEAVQPVLEGLKRRYGSREHLVEEIASYLRSIGRTYPLPIVH